MAEAHINVSVTVRTEFTLAEVGLLCDALQNPQGDGEGTEHKETRERLYTVLSEALQKGYART